MSGLWGKPTIVQNVETLCNVPPILRHGAQWYLGLSRSEDGGTKIYGVSGKVRRPGAWELPLGTTMREILERRARWHGAMATGCGASCPVAAPPISWWTEHLDTGKMDYDTMQARRVQPAWAPAP